MKKEYGFPFRGGWVKAKKKPIDGFPKKKERTFQLEQNYRLNLLFSFKEKPPNHYLGFWACFEWGSLEEPLTLVIKVIFQAFNLQKILWICQDNLWVFSHNGTHFFKEHNSEFLGQM